MVPAIPRRRASGRWTGAGAGGGQPPGGGRGNQGPTIGIPGFYKLEDTNGDDVMDTIERIQRYTSNGMGDHGPHAIRRGPDGSIMFLVGNNTYVGAAPVNDDAVDKAASPNWNNSKERQFLPQFNDPRFGNSTRIGVHATVWRLQPDKKFALFYSGMRNPYDFAYNLAGEAFVFDSDMEWDVNAPWYREVRTAHMIPGGDAGYRNGTGKYQDEYFDTLPALRHLRRGSPVGVEVYQSYAYPPSFFDNLFEADWSRGRLLYTALTPSGATYTGREDLAEFVHGEPMPISRSRSRTRRQHLPDDRRRRRTGRALQGELDGAEAAAAGHDRRPRRRPATAADSRAGVGRRSSVSKTSMGASFALRAREAGANGDGGIGRSRPRRAGDAAAWRGAEPRVC